MAQLLRRSKFGESPLNEQTDESLAQFMNLVNQNELAGYILESIYLLGLESVFRARTINDGGSPADVFSLISRHAALEAIKFEKFDNKFVKFLDLTKALQAQLVWLKGIVTSRTCYTEPSQRLSGDFDCFLDSQFAHELHEILYEDGFRIIGADNGFCNQLGVGPVVSLDNLFLVPEDQFVPSAVMGYFKNRCPILDVKFNPLDRGLKMIELERFKSECTLVNWRGRQFLAPSLIDQLIIALTHLEKDRFLGWKQLLDIKLIAEKINETPDSWSEFVRRCRVEGVSTACCAGLSLAQDRLGLSGVEKVIAETNVAGQGISRRLFSFTVTPLFYWNTSSLPMLFANAALADDSPRKTAVLRRSFVPRKDFLANYYFGKQNLNPLEYSLGLLLHWLVLFLPGGLIRRTFGPRLWKGKQFGTQS
ncbi:MAG TPA: nucleotidyltransferase family protein [Drouetiella sp.]